MRHGLSLGPAIIYQDNKSAMYLAKKGRSTSERSRHIKICDKESDIPTNSDSVDERVFTINGDKQFCKYYSE